MNTNDKILEKFDKGHKNEKIMEVAEAKAEVQIALDEQREVIIETVEKKKEKDIELIKYEKENGRWNLASHFDSCVRALDDIIKELKS